MGLIYGSGIRRNRNGDGPPTSSNLLTPPGLVRSNLYVHGRVRDPMSRLDPMPMIMGAYVQTERCTRRLCQKNRTRIGNSKEWKIDPRKITKGMLQNNHLFHWEYMPSTLSRPARNHPPAPSPQQYHGKSSDQPTNAICDWRDPFLVETAGLQEGGLWWINGD
jgi:hypothetical protein